jgi:hypothetical protein
MAAVKLTALVLRKANREPAIPLIRRTAVMRGCPAPHPDGVNANPLPADLSGNPCRGRLCRNDGLVYKEPEPKLNHLDSEGFQQSDQLDQR